MKKLKKEEIPEILPISKGRNTMLRVQLLQLAVGEGLFLPKAEWKTKNSPAHIVARIKKKHGMQFEYGFKPDGMGWLFRRGHEGITAHVSESYAEVKMVPSTPPPYHQKAKSQYLKAHTSKLLAQNPYLAVY